MNARISILLSFSLVVPASVALVVAPAAADDSELTRSERAALEAGELVTRPMHLRRGNLNLIGGTSWQRIDASAEMVWRALLDSDHYPNILPAAVEARVIETRDTTREVFIRHSAWPFQASYYVWIESDAESRTLSFRLNTDRSSGLRAGWGFARVTMQAGKTCLVFGILADVGAGMLGVLARPVIQPWMLRVPQQVKLFVERGAAPRP